MASSKRCAGTTMSGGRCQRTTTEVSGVCGQCVGRIPVTGRAAANTARIGPGGDPLGGDTEAQKTGLGSHVGHRLAVDGAAPEGPVVVCVDCGNTPVAAEKAPEPAVIVTVNGGIADVSASPGVRVVHIDNDSWRDADPAWAARQDLLYEIGELEALPDGAGPALEASRYGQIVESLDRLADPHLFGSATCPECGGEESCGVPGVNRHGRRCESCEGGYDTDDQAAAAAARVFTAARAGRLSLDRRAGIAMAPRVPADVLEALADDSDPPVRQMVASNPGCPPATRARIGLLAN